MFINIPVGLANKVQLNIRVGLYFFHRGVENMEK